MSVSIPFTKMVAAGNDFVIVDAVRRLAGGSALPWPAVARTLCRRHDGIGADGLLLLGRARRGDVRMRVFNPDGSEAQMCGNGARCVARYIDRRRARRETEVLIETAGGLVRATVHGQRVRVRLPDPVDLRVKLGLRVAGQKLEATAINTGVPHAVVRVRGLDAVEVDRLGRALRFHRAFGPRGTNVDFIEADAGRRDRLRVRTYERGVEAETLACGTGVAASAVVHAMDQALAGHRPQAGNGVHGLTRRVSVQTRSGEVMTVSMQIVPDGRRPGVRGITLEGTATQICEGTVSWPLGGRR